MGLFAVRVEPDTSLPDTAWYVWPRFNTRLYGTPAGFGPIGAVGVIVMMVSSCAATTAKKLIPV
jgi:hypothetical protein